MRYCISSMFLLTLCETSLFHYFQFATAADGTTSSTRSTPSPTESPSNIWSAFQNKYGGNNFTDRGTTKYYLYRRTAFDLLRFWSGESLKIRRHNHNHKNNTNHTSEERDSNETIYNKAHARRKSVRNDDDDSLEDDEKSSFKSTRFALVDGTTAATSPDDAHKHENLKLNGYTLKQDMIHIMSKLDANVTITTVGTTIEFHDIVLCQISKKPAKYFRALEGEDKYVVEEPQKKIILIVHGLTPMGFRKVPCLYQSDDFLRLVRMYSEHLDKFDIFLVPMGNPDGISDETLMIWNKNKSPQSSCPGVYVDRNFDVGWNKTEQVNSCSQEYPGPRPFSELESRAVADLIHHYNPKIVAYIHVHAGSYDPKVFKGDAVLYPKGYVDQPEDDKYGDIESEIEDALRMAGFRVFGVTVTNLYDWYGQIPGSSVDYATTVYGIPYGMEFVMQPYAEEDAEYDSEEISTTVLDQVWKRVIDTIFTNIYRSTEKQGETN